MNAQPPATDAQDPGAMVANLLLFGRVLRAAGVVVHHGRIVDAIRALEWIGVGSRTDVHALLRALLVHRHEDLPVFDRAFELFFRAHGDSELTLPLFSLGERARVVTRRISGVPQHAELQDVVAEGSSSAATLAISAYSNVEVSRGKDFSEFTPEELEAVRRLLLRMPWDPGRRPTRRWERAARGVIDLRRILRRNVMNGGTPMDLPRRLRREAPRSLVILADVSGSMERYSRVLLYFASGLTRTARNVESFLFATRLTRVTRQLTGRAGHRAVTRVVRDLQDWGGGTRIGESLRTFNTNWARRVMRHGPVVLIVSDGWDRGDPALVGQELARLRRSCSRLVWLNPLLGSSTYEPLTRGMQAALEHVDDFLPIHNLASVEELVTRLRDNGKPAARSRHRAAGSYGSSRNL